MEFAIRNSEIKGLILYTILSYITAYTLDYTIILPRLSIHQNLNFNIRYFIEIGGLIARMWTPALSVLLTLRIVDKFNPLDFLRNNPVLRETSYIEALRISAVILIGYTLASLLSIGLGAKIGGCGYNKYLNPAFIIGEIALGVILGVTVNSVVALGEELGWRGYMYITLRKRFGLLQTSIIIGIIWGLWHAPLILSGYNYIEFIPGCNYKSSSTYQLMVFTLYTIAASILLTEIRESTGSVYSAAVGHGVLNGVASRMSALISGNPLTTLPAGLTASIGLFFAAVVWRWWPNDAKKN